MTYSDYKHSIPIQVRFSDIDRLNHVNNACYLNYFELGRVNYFKVVFGEHIDWNKKGFILARTEIDHLEPIFLNDEVFCFTKIIKIGTKSLTFKNTVLKIKDGNIVECANGIGVLVGMDYLNNLSIELPPEWIELINKFEGV